ncbi:MAG: hypothetical protein MZV64_64480 [Ignavibacteriales bacterium]|nr:hypothetical protein [Ignavibacteriales bacterium]
MQRPRRRLLAALDVLAACAEVAAAARLRAARRSTTATASASEEGRHPVVEAASGRALHPQRPRSWTARQRPGPDHHRPEHGRQVDLPAPDRAHRHPGPDGRASSRPREARDRPRATASSPASGATDSLLRGQSTFMVEMMETAAHPAQRHRAQPRSSSTRSAAAPPPSTACRIAWAVAEHLARARSTRPKTLFATHYHELTELAADPRRGSSNYHVAVQEWQDEVVFLRKIDARPDPTGASASTWPSWPASRATVIDRAQEILLNLEKQELDEAGLPRLARRGRASGDRSQMMLFAEDREYALLRELREEIEGLDLASLTPLDALNILAGLKARTRSPGPVNRNRALLRRKSRLRDPLCPFRPRLRRGPCRRRPRRSPRRRPLCAPRGPRRTRRGPRSGGWCWRRRRCSRARDSRPR